MTLRRPFSKSLTLRVGLPALLWLAFIAALHVHLNADPAPIERVVMGYMPVITNLAAPLVDAVSKESGVRFEAMKFGSFAEMGEAFRSRHIDAAFIIAPLAVALFQQGVPLRVVYIGNRHESTMVVRLDCPWQSLSDVSGTFTVAVPIRYSGHLLALKRALRQKGLGADTIRLVEVPPPDMPAALASGGIDGYFVGEPFAGKSLAGGLARRFLDVEQIWPGFICNVMIVREELIRSHPDWVRKLVRLAARSGFWAQDHTEEAARLAAGYWNQDPSLPLYVFSHPPGRFRFDLFMPAVSEFDEIVEEMVLNGLLPNRIDVTGMVDDRFAREVQVEAVASFKDIAAE